MGATLPEGTIVVDEGNTSGLFVAGATAGAPRHDWLTLTGGAIGIGLPMATGAAVAAPDRPVLCLQADGSAMYTLQALWTQAREGLNVTTVVLSNRSYAILNMELHRVGADAGGPLARRLLDLTDPELDFCDLARGMGVPGPPGRERRGPGDGARDRASPSRARPSLRCCSEAIRAWRATTTGQRSQCADNKRDVACRIGSNGSIAPEMGLSPCNSKRACSTSSPGDGLYRGGADADGDGQPSFFRSSCHGRSPRASCAGIS